MEDGATQRRIGFMCLVTGLSQMAVSMTMGYRDVESVEILCETCETTARDDVISQSKGDGVEVMEKIGDRVMKRRMNCELIAVWQYLWIEQLGDMPRLGQGHSVTVTR